MHRCAITVSLLTNKYGLKVLYLCFTIRVTQPWDLSVSETPLGCCKLCLARCTDGLPKEALGHLRLNAPIRLAEVGVNVKIGAVNQTERDYLR